MSASEFLTVEEVAERYRTSPSTVHHWVHNGTAPRSLRVGKRRLFPVEGLEEWEADRADDQPRHLRAVDPGQAS